MSTNVLPVLTHVSVVNIQERQKLVLVGIRELCRTDYFRAKHHFSEWHAARRPKQKKSHWMVPKKVEKLVTKKWW